MSKLGISIRDSNLSFKDFSTILEEIAGRWQTLDNVSQRAIANAFAGVRQQEAFTTLLQNWDKYQELLEISQRSKGTAETKYAAYQQSLQAAQSARKTTWEQLANNVEVSELLIAVNTVAKWLGQAIPFLLKWGPHLLILLDQIATIRGGGILNGLMRSPAGQALGNGLSGVGGWFSKMWKRLFHTEQQITQEDQKQLLAEKQATLEESEQLQAEKQQTQQDQQQAASGAGGGDSTKKGLGGAHTKAQTVISGITYGIGQLASGMSAYETSGATHKFTNAAGERTDVNSSTRAREAGRGVAAALAVAIPFVGGMFGTWLGDKISGWIDEERDKANERTRVAQENLHVLTSTQTNLETMIRLRNAATATDEKERDQAIAEYVSTMYASDNTAVREILQNYLKQIYGETKTIRQVTEAMHSGDEKERAQAAHALELAQAQAEHAQTRQARAADNYAEAEKLREAMLTYNASRPGYAANGVSKTTNGLNIGLGAGAGAAAGGLVMGGEAAAMLATAGAASAIPAVGWIIAVVLAAAAGVGAGIAAYKSKSAFDETEEARNWSFEEQWENLGLDDKISRLRDVEEELKNAVEENTAGAAATLEATQALREAYEEYREYLWAQYEEDNKAKMDEALIYAGWQYDGAFNTNKNDINSTEYFLKDLNVVQAKNYGQKALYDALAEALGEDALKGINIKNAQGEYTDYFVTYARRIMSENDAVGSVLSGEAYTLNEALEKLGANTDQFSRATMQDFARAMRVAHKELGDYSELVGELTLAELMMNTTKLEEEFDNLYGVLGKVSDGTQSVTKWMTDIVAHYPDLINYMSSTPALITAIVNKLYDLNNQTMREQYEEYGESTPFWEKTMLPGAEGWLAEQAKQGNITSAEQEAVLKLVRDQSITKLNDAVQKLAVVPSLAEDSPLRRTYELMEKAIEAGTNGVILRSDIWTEQTQKLTNFIAEQLKTQVAALEAQKQALQDVNKQRQYEVELLDARNKLSDALNQKQRVYRTGVGFVYEPDQSAIKKAKEELQEVQLQKDVSKITKQIDILQEEAKSWETLWSRKTQELQEAVIGEIWGENATNFKRAIFGDSTQQALNVGTDGVKVDAASLTTQLNTIFGTDSNAFSTSLQTAVFGSSETLATWWQKTGATSVATLCGYLEQIIANQNKETNPQVLELQQAYKNYNQLAARRGMGLSVDAEEWNTALRDYETKFTAAKKAGLIDDNWAFNQNYNLTAQSHAQGSSYQYLYNPLDVGKHIDQLLMSPEPQIQAVGAALVGQLIQTRSSKGPQEFVEARGQLGALMNEGLKNVGKDGKAWYWTAENIATGGASLGKAANSKLLALFTTANNWHEAAENWQNAGYGDALVWTQGTGTILLSGGQAYSTLFEAYSSNQADHIATYSRTGALYALSDREVQFAVKHWTEIAAALRNQGFTASAIAAQKTKMQAEAQKRSIPYASGTLGTTSSGLGRVNETGLEAIVTPAGTIAALPAHTGIVPADLTRNLWQLGEVAPSILRVAETIAPNSILSSGSKATVTDQSFNINNLSMNVSADDSFDVDAFIEAIKSRVALTHHAHR